MFGFNKNKKRRDLTTAKTLKADILSPRSGLGTFSVEERQNSELPTVHGDFDSIVNYDDEGRATVNTQALETIAQRTMRDTTVVERRRPRSMLLLVALAGVVIGLAGTVLVSRFLPDERTVSLAEIGLEKAIVAAKDASIEGGEAAQAPVLGDALLDIEKEAQLDAARASLRGADAGLPEPSEVVEHAKGRSINTGNGIPVFMAGSQRVYGPNYVTADIAEAQPPSAQVVKGQVAATQKGSDAAGRYSVPGSDLEWQGRWAADNPQRNIELGSAYTEYLEQRFGSGLTSNLSSFEPQRTNVLRSLSSAGSPARKIQSYAK